MGYIVMNVEKDIFDMTTFRHCNIERISPLKENELPELAHR